MTNGALGDDPALHTQFRHDDRYRCSGIGSLLHHKGHIPSDNTYYVALAYICLNNSLPVSCSMLH